MAIEPIRESTQADIKADLLRIQADFLEDHGFDTRELRRLAEEMCRQQWQPIETAPHDNAAKLVWCPERQNTYIAVWQIGIYEDFEPGWGHFGTSGEWLRETPTHWMPLPEPPTK